MVLTWMEEPSPLNTMKKKDAPERNSLVFLERKSTREATIEDLIEIVNLEGKKFKRKSQES